MFKNQMLDIIFSPWAANTLYCAQRLNIFNLLSGNRMTAEELAKKTGAVPRYLKALLDACTAMGLLQQKNHLYMNSHLGNVYLVEGNPLYLGDIIEVLDTDAGSWEGLYDMVTGAAKTGPAKGERQASAHRFTMAMNNLAMQGEAEALANAANLADARKMVDVGCGSGIYSAALCRHYPNLHAELLDTGEVLETTREIIKKNKLQDRIDTREADIRKDSYGEKLDVVLLSDVLYPQESVCMNILQSSYRALVPGGTLLVRGYFPDPDGSNPVFASLFTLAQLLSDPKREIITVSLLCQWLEQVSFKVFKTFPLTERSTCLTAKK